MKFKDIVDTESYKPTQKFMDTDSYKQIQKYVASDAYKQIQKFMDTDAYEQIQKFVDIDPYKQIRDFIETDAYRQIQKIIEENPYKKIQDILGSDYQRWFQSISYIPEDSIQAKMKDVFDFMSKDYENISDLTKSLKPYQDILSSTIRLITDNNSNTLLPSILFDKYSMNTKSLADTIIQLNRLDIIPFDRVPEKQIRILYDDPSFKNKVTYSATEDLPEGRMLLEFEDGICEVYEKPDIDSIRGFLPTCKRKDCTDFITFLGSFPMLGLLHPVGKKIYTALKDNWNNYVTELDPDIVFYRCRKNEKEKTSIPAQKMFDPPYGKSSINRFNWYGLNHLYMADSLKTAKAEIGYIDSKSIGITTMNATAKKPARLFRLDKNQSATFAYCLFQDSGDDNNSHNYLLPNFLSQCLYYLVMEKDIQLDGIMYPSVKCEGTGSCFVFFNKHFEDFKNVDVPASDV